MWVVIVAALLIVLNLFSDGGGQKPQQELSYSEFLQRVDSGQIRQVTIKGAAIIGILEDGSVFKSLFIFRLLSFTSNSKFPLLGRLLEKLPINLDLNGTPF